MSVQSLRFAVSTLALLGLAACGGSQSSGSFSIAQPPPPDEVVRSESPQLSNRSATGSAGMAYILLNGQSVELSDSVSLEYSDGSILGNQLNGLDIDESAFSNPANGEFSRVFRISGSTNLFGVVGLDVATADLPATGTTTSYNEGWVGMQAIFVDRTLTLEGDATFTTSWDENGLSGRFFNLDGEDSLNGDAGNVGEIILTGATISGDQFTGGQVTGTGSFSGLGTSSDTNGTAGYFFGPAADELGGVLIIDNDTGDVEDDIQVFGVFQAD